MSVSNSKFMGRIEVEFNQQNNAVVGGRGTGKSTIRLDPNAKQPFTSLRRLHLSVSPTKTRLLMSAAFCVISRT
ncbi:MAG: hypothetical protein DMG96_16955 [Acidobacteria bacterium]|nr:MAG: hypothetical protein DMG96_16955 [Acidobacteriota bacterium]